ncbi:MAG: uroporphyrinogen decarboxylase family protein [Candidatus Latescibacteria bacterium]|jgi:uroporphyrinogen decarboxylase|nr:uroporphyrinogen decarboxylase family protein [Candidatus Latescibacterota bacterium]
MAELTGAERIGNILRRKPVDRIGLFEHFWGDTLKKWRAEGHISEGEDLATHFGFDMAGCGPLRMVARLDFEPEVLEETEETIVKRDGNGAVLRTHKLHNTTPEHIDFEVKERTAWEEKIRPLLTPTRERINFEAYREAKARAAESQRFFCWTGVNVFELMHPVCGHEYMLIGMAEDPDWVRDMATVFSDITIALMEILFHEEGLPDGIWFFEDMGFKERPFMSPAMYEAIIQPAHQKTVDYAHSKGLPVVMHSCGFVEPLLPGMVEAGIDCLQVIEVKAGMDLLRIKRDFGDRLVLCGGMDARNLVANDLDAIREELQEKIPVVKEDSGYILHSDHSIPTTTDYETYRYFVDEGLRLGVY